MKAFRGSGKPPVSRALGFARVFAFMSAAGLEILAGTQSGPAAPSPVDAEWTVEAADGEGLRLSWKNRRGGSAGEGGIRSVAIAVPPGAVAQAVLESSIPGRGSVALSAPSRFRDVLVAALSFDPSGPGPAGPSVEIATSARIRIAFKKGAGSDRATFASDPEHPAERHLESWLLNHAQSRSFRSSPPSPLRKAGAEGPGNSSSLPKVRLVIRTLGENIQVLTYDSLRKAGLPLDALDPRTMRLYDGGREVPLYVHGEADGRWDPGDHIEFIGKRAAGQATHNSLFAARGAFILAWGGGRGLRAPAVPVAPRSGASGISLSGARPAPPFAAREHLEEDLDILRIGSTSAEEIQDLGARVQESELTDFWFWKRLGPEKDVAELPFDLPYTPFAPVSGTSPDPGGGSLRVTISLKGITNNPKADPDHHLKFLLNGSDISLANGVRYDAIWEGQETHTWVSPPLNPGILKAGKGNVLAIQKVNDLKTSEGQPVEFQDAYINFVRLEFPSTYAVAGDRLAFSNTFADSVGTRVFTLSGFTSENVSLWDKKGRKLVNFRMARRGDGFELSFLDSLPGRTDFIASTASLREVPRVELDTLDDLISPSQGADYLVITDKPLLGRALDSLVDFRRKQGLRARVVMARHIYQAFGDGSMDPAALRRFVAHAYANWARPAPTYLLLVGDASQGFEKKGHTVVPTHPINIRGWGVAANDDYFAKVSGDDDIADLLVGRLPVSSREDLSKIVRKTLLLEKERPQGHWSNKALLVAGFEASFTAQNNVLQGIAVSRDRQVSRLDLYPGSPHYRNAAQRGNFYDQLDSGFNLVSFVGHGGGAVWSDAGVLTLKALSEGRLKGDFPISLVSSITCLTGFFEDFSAPSLGEEMLRLDKGGAAGFYGAAGYISNLAGEALSAEILKAATGNANATTGAIVAQAETMVRLRTGDAFLPVLAEFNLLGDPALRLAFPEKEGSLSLDPVLLAGEKGISAAGSGLAMNSGEGMATLLLGDSTAGEEKVSLAGSSFSFRRPLAGGAEALRHGKVVVHYWDDAESRVLSAPFTSLDWLIDSVTIDPPDAAPGDSARIQLRLNTAYSRVSLAGGIASHVVGGEVAPLFPGENQVVLESEDGIHVNSAAKILLGVPDADKPGPTLHLAFRLDVKVLDEEGAVKSTLPNLSSRTYSLPLSELPRLELPRQAFRLPIQNELGVWISVHNKGLWSASGFKMRLDMDVGSPEPETNTQAYNGALGFGETDSMFFPLPDSMMAGKRLRATLVPSKAGELAEGASSQDTIFQVLTSKLSSTSDTLRLDSSGSFLALPPDASQAKRAFVEALTVSSLPGHLDPASGALPLPAYRISAPDFEMGSLILGMPLRESGLPKQTAHAESHWHYAAAPGGSWLKLDAQGSADSHRSKAFRSGIYALLANRDASGPLIQLSSRGQVILPDDYVPLRTPIDVVIRDGEGVDLAMHPPALESRRQAPDSSNLFRETAADFPNLARMQFTPDQGSERDSLTVTARDVSGNITIKTLAYRMGDDLRIRDLGSYPNPFADTATFVFSLTDHCDRVDLKVFSRAGRAVRTLELRNVVGYQEVVWDGRAGSGAAIANGLYFLKVTARSGSKETSKIFKLFKKQRK